MSGNDMVERVADAIERAQCPGREGPYGLYDYTSYGHPKPHHVRDFRCPRSDTWGSAVLMTSDREEAEATYKRLTREHVARAAIEAMREPTEAMLVAGAQHLDYGQDGWLLEIWPAMIGAALTDTPASPSE